MRSAKSGSRGRDKFLSVCFLLCGVLLACCARSGAQALSSEYQPVPLGEPRNTPFAGDDENTATDLYDAQFREYGIQGRWPSPDPAGIAAVNPSNPQSWNRYAYVLNNPLKLTDPSGRNPNGPNQPAAMEGYGGVDVGGCDEFDWANASCQQTMNELNDNWSPFGIQYIGPASDGKTVTFDTWDQYAQWSTVVAAGASDPCVYMNDSATDVESVDSNSSPGECSSTGGTWVPPAYTWKVNPEEGKVVLTGLTPQACNQMNRGLFWLNVGATIYGADMGGLWGGLGANLGMQGSNYYLNNKLCGGPGLSGNQ